MKKISQWIVMLKDYIKKGKSSEKNGNKLVKTIMKNQETIRNMDTYYDQETQIKERDNVENLTLSL